MYMYLHTYIHTYIHYYISRIFVTVTTTNANSGRAHERMHTRMRARAHTHTHTHTHTHNTVDNRKRHKKSHHVLAKSKNSLFRVSRVRAHALMTNSLHWICRVVSSRGVMRCHNTQCLCHEVSQHSMFVQMSGKS